MGCYTIYQDNVHQQSSCTKLADQSEQSEQALVDALAVEDQIRLVKKKELDQKCLLFRLTVVLALLGNHM